MISNVEEWHYIAVEKLSALLIGITSKYKDDLCCLNCLHSFRTKTKLNHIIRVRIKTFLVLKCILKTLKY